MPYLATGVDLGCDMPHLSGRFVKPPTQWKPIILWLCMFQTAWKYNEHVNIVTSEDTWSFSDSYPTIWIICRAKLDGQSARIWLEEYWGWFGLSRALSQGELLVLLFLLYGMQSAFLCKICKSSTCTSLRSASGPGGPTWKGWQGLWKNE